MAGVGSGTAPAVHRVPIAGRQKPPAESLAFCFEACLAAIAGLRSHGQAEADAELFRSRMRRAVRVAEQSAGRRGYTPEDARLAAFAVVAFFDESVLSSPDPAFAGWRPLQEELFESTDEVFFQNMEQALARRDSMAVADLIEVYLLCILLGYRGGYEISGEGDIRELADTLLRRMCAIRGPVGICPRSALLPDEPAPPVAGGWMARLRVAMIVAAAVAFIAFAGFWLGVNSVISDIHPPTEAHSQ